MYCIRVADEWQRRRVCRRHVHYVPAEYIRRSCIREYCRQNTIMCSRGNKQTFLQTPFFYMSVNFCGINISYSVQCGCAVKISWLTLVILMPKGCWVHVNIFTRYTQSLTLCICPSARPLVIICLFLELHHETVVLAASMFLDSPAAGTRYLYCFVLFPWHLDNSATSWRHVFSVRSVVSHCCDCLDRKICALYIFRTELTILTARVSIGQLVACWYSDDGNKSVIGFVTNCTVNTHWCSLFFNY